jgi:alkylmercury lyase
MTTRPDTLPLRALAESLVATFPGSDDAPLARALLDDEAEVASSCPMTGTEVRLTIAPGRVRAAYPDDVWVSFPSPAQTSTDDIVESFCCHVHLLAGTDSAGRWASARPGSFALGLADAFELGRLATRAFFTPVEIHR